MSKDIDYSKISTLGDLKRSGYKTKSVKLELRDNLIAKLKKKEKVFDGIWGYEETVIPDLERAILSMHDINLLGLRGQAKTRLARLMIDLLDEFIPVIKDTELNDDPFNPISRQARDIIEECKDATPVSWMHRGERYTEKLATPDVSIADLIGDVDPIKAATLKLPYSDERVIHFGLIPRSHRGLFVFNELPDLQARIQVALFNILQEGDIQIRGFKIRLPLDIQFVFTANPEDYTNRGSIVTPLKDRIDSQIITHYPRSIEVAKKITEQEARVREEQKVKIGIHDFLRDLLEQIAIEARKSEYVDEKSGVSARLTISGMENLYSAAERRTLINNEEKTHIRISDFAGVIPSITGKIELVYEGEQEGPGIVAQSLLGKAVRTQLVNYLPDPEKSRKQKESNPYSTIISWFREGNTLDLLNDESTREFRKKLDSVPGLERLVTTHARPGDKELKYLFMEFALHGLAEFSLLSKNLLSSGSSFKDLVSNLFTMPDEGDKGEEDEDFYK
ncbi:MAG TPA: magnesium chelatase [Cyclobacteriaceae bacterium]|jgi:magnesium chelatase subunit I